MRAKSNIFHMDCFRCAACAKQLVPGDEFSLAKDNNGLLFCKEHSANDCGEDVEGKVKMEENNNDGEVGSKAANVEELGEDEDDDEEEIEKCDNGKC